MLKTEERPKIDIETLRNTTLARREPVLKDLLPEESLSRIAEAP